MSATAWKDSLVVVLSLLWTFCTDGTNNGRWEAPHEDWKREKKVTKNRMRVLGLLAIPALISTTLVSTPVYADDPSAISTISVDSSSDSAKDSFSVATDDMHDMPSDTAASTPSVTATPKVTPSPSTTPKASASPSKTPKATPSATKTPKATPSNKPEEVNLNEGQMLVFRLYNPISHEHLYSTDAYERDTLSEGDWNYEGIGWVAPRISSTPVYRLYNAALGDHHYTTDRNEVQVLTRQFGWKNEGAKWYSSDGKEVSVYRQFHEALTIGSHNFTTDKHEYKVNNKAGWNGEGTAWYAIEGFSSGKATIENDQAYASVEATARLRGYGTGYHAKVTISGQNGAIASFGIQHDRDSESPIARTGAVFMVENVMSHATEPGKRGKEYLFYSKAPLDEDVKIRLSWYKKKNELRYYVNDMEIGRTTTTFTTSLAFSVEGSVKRRGDFIDASFTNVRVKAGDNVKNYGTMGQWNDKDRGFFGLHSVIARNGVANSGTPSQKFTTNGVNSASPAIYVWGRSTIPAGYDWDTSFQLYDKGTNNHPISGYVDIAQKGRYLTEEEANLNQPDPAATPSASVQ